MPSGAPPSPASTRNLPGVGAAISCLGLLIFLVAHVSMDWIEVRGGSANLNGIVETADNNSTYQWEIVAIYGDWAWMFVFAVLAALATLATLANPVSKGLRATLWTLALLPAVGILGLVGLINLADTKGTLAPRILGTLGLIGPIGILTVVWIDLIVDADFIAIGTGDLGMGFWMAWAGIIAVLVGNAVGTRSVPAPGHPPYGPH